MAGAPSIPPSLSTSTLAAAVAVVTLSLAANLPATTARSRPNSSARGAALFYVELPLKEGSAVRGERMLGVGQSAPYYAFRGIPYAAAPIGDLRFKNPRPAVLGEGTLDATVEGAKCAQVALPSRRLEGEEDCLFLNVYTPRLERLHRVHREQPLMPVMVYLHGGGFQYGSGTAAENGPDFLVHHDVVLVTVNYRLGALGFLNLDNDDLPGNMGLKDQRAALQWVQENIEYFDGDPARVTLFGNSAGAASVHYHTLVPASRGLFGAAILQSGSALASYAYQENHLEMAQRLSQQLGTNSSDPQQMAAAFRRASIADILAATTRIVQSDPRLQLGIPPFAPSPERRRDGEDKFLTGDPESLLLAPQVAAVPTVAGITGEEGLFALYFGGLNQQPATVAALAANPALLLPPNLTPYMDTVRVLGLGADGDKPSLSLSATQAAGYGERIKSEYLAGTNVTEDQGPFVTLLGDLFNVVPLHRAAALTKRSEDAPLFLYHFVMKGAYNWGKASFNITEKGATHTDELGYLMHITSPTDLGQTFRGHADSDSSRALRQLTRMWTDFAKSRHPLPEEPKCWHPATGSILTAPYARIDSAVSKAHGLGGPRMKLWDEIYAEQRAP